MVHAAGHLANVVGPIDDLDLDAGRGGLFLDGPDRHVEPRIDTDVIYDEPDGLLAQSDEPQAVATIASISADRTRTVARIPSRNLFSGHDDCSF